ncbi:uncharacterized protein [Temnothorax nylanderi]|uniref:uncharacterized protein isoform X1 n=1 Tax=Temnothorax nylanderi TaxID=102681 RepID=UPI003A8AD53B
MVDTIEKALNPLFLANFIFGCGILRYPLDKPRYCLSIFYILTVWSVYACAVYYVTIQYSLTISNSSPGSLIEIMNLFIIMISIIIIVREHEKFRTCIRKLDLVNDTLEELGMPKEYHKLRNLMKCALITWFLMACASWTFDSLMCIDILNETRAMMIPIVMDYSLHINNIIDIMFMLLLRHIGSILDKINDYIVQLSETENCGLRYKWKKSLVVNSHIVRSAESRKRILFTVMHLHLELCRIAHDINGFFGMQMTLQIISYFVVLSGLFYFLYYIILHLKEVYEDDITLKILLSINMWVIIFLMKLISLNHICESVSVKARKTKNVVNRLTNLVGFAEVREEISQFVLQILLRPLKFSGLGLFYFGYDFIRKFFVWIVTVVLFMVQIHDIYIFPISQILDK